MRIANIANCYFDTRYMQLKVKEMGQLRLSQKTQKPKNYKVVNLQI